MAEGTLRRFRQDTDGIGQVSGHSCTTVYEMIAGRRHIQPNEIEPMAKFLDGHG